MKGDVWVGAEASWVFTGEHDQTDQSYAATDGDSTVWFHRADAARHRLVRSAPDPTPTQSPPEDPLAAKMEAARAASKARMDAVEANGFRKGWEAARAEAAATALEEAHTWEGKALLSTEHEDHCFARGGSLAARRVVERVERLAALPSALPTTKETT